MTNVEYTSDRVAVVHGRWTEKEWSVKCDWCVTIHNSIICSACNHEIYKGYKTPYCPYCGAKMDGDTE